MKRYPNATEVVWCQEEPQNQGAWYQSGHYLRQNMREDQKLYYAGRPASAAPAAGGYMARHNERQKAHWWSRRSATTSRGSFSRRVTRWFFGELPGFSEPGGGSAEAGEKLNGRSADDRGSEGAAIVGVGRRGDAPRLAQEGRRAGLARREPDRHRDRQGRARAAGARRRRAGQDPQESARLGRLGRRHRPDRHRGQGRGRGAAARGKAAGGAPKSRNGSGSRHARRAEDRGGEGHRHLEDPGHRPRRPRHQGRCS